MDIWKEIKRQEQLDRLDVDNDRRLTKGEETMKFKPVCPICKKPFLDVVILELGGFIYIHSRQPIGEDPNSDYTVSGCQVRPQFGNPIVGVTE